jgi:hypothetical protein
MFFVFFPLGQGEFAKQILLGGLHLSCLVMVHMCHPIGSAGDKNIVSPDFLN